MSGSITKIKCDKWMNEVVVDVSGLKDDINMCYYIKMTSEFHLAKMIRYLFGFCMMCVLLFDGIYNFSFTLF